MNNPHAFPSPGVVIDYNRDQHQQGAYEGMSLRDYFAAQFAAAVLSNTEAMDAAAQDCQDDLSLMSSIAERSYALADAMLAERAK